MMIKTVRNIICRRLYDFLGRPVLLHDQTDPEAKPPMLYYQLVGTLIPLGGASIWQDGSTQYRREPTEATISITAVSYDRDGRDGRIYGDDEALELAERAMSWMLHIGQRQMCIRDRRSIFRSLWAEQLQKFRRIYGTGYCCTRRVGYQNHAA